jgi:hypothetical protein
VKPTDVTLELHTAGTRLQVARSGVVRFADSIAYCRIGVVAKTVTLVDLTPPSMVTSTCAFGTGFGMGSMIRGINCHRLCYACVGMVSKSRSETLHVRAKTLARLDDRATVVVSIFLTRALQYTDGRRGAGGSA